MSFTLKELILAVLATFVITMTCAYGCARHAVTQADAAASQALKDAAGHVASAQRIGEKIATDTKTVQADVAKTYANAEKVTVARRHVNQGAVAVPKVLPVDVSALQDLVIKQQVEIENYKELTDAQATENASLKVALVDQGKLLAETQMQSDEWKKAYLAQQVASKAYHDAMKQSSFKSGFKGFLWGVAAAEAANLASKRK